MLTDRKLARNFWLSEFLQSQSADRMGLDNTPAQAYLENLYRTACMMQHLRDMIAAPIQITSGYRSPDVNRAVGGSYHKDSQGKEILSAHTSGQAADFHAPSFGTPFAIAKLIEKNLHLFPEVDQVIYEFTWVHLAWSDTPRSGVNRVLTIRSPNIVRAGILETI